MTSFITAGWPQRARTRRTWDAGSILARLFVLLVYLFILSPLLFVLWLSVFKDGIISFPPSGYSLAWYRNVWDNDTFFNGFSLSIQVAVIAAVTGVFLGVTAALAIVRYPFRGGKVINSFLLSPLVVPGIVAGIAIYLFYLRLESWLGIDLVGTYYGLVLAHVSLTIPWTVRLVSASLVGMDLTVEEAARNLGANPLIVFRRITLPMLRPAIIAAALFSFIVSFENLEVSLPLIGPGRTTLPIAVMQYLQFSLDPTIAAVSSLQIILLGVAMLVTDRFVKLSRVVG